MFNFWPQKWKCESTRMTLQNGPDNLTVQIDNGYTYLYRSCGITPSGGFSFNSMEKQYTLHVTKVKQEYWTRKIFIRLLAKYLDVVNR